MLTMVHTNPASTDGKVFKVDRKFHVGMQTYAEKIETRVTTVNPRLSNGMNVMDLVEVPLADLAYDVITIEIDEKWRPVAGELPRLKAQISGSRLIYDGGRLGTPKLARDSGVPYILMLEYDLRTQMSVAANGVRLGIRPAVRAMRCAWRYATTEIPDMRHAHSVHCNGYPMFDAAQSHNANILLYLDSRMSASMVITSDQLATRLSQRPGRPLKILYSGRYERIKGADDAVKVVVECVNRNMDVELHCYGQGSLRKQMEQVAASAKQPHRIRIHDAVTYAELVDISRTFDLFVCCHIQGDPSCTYLESLGAGLPIVGYANQMWRRLSETSGAGFAAPVGETQRMADAIQRMASDLDLLSDLSRRAQAFALEHTFEREFDRRVDALNAALT